MSALPPAYKGISVDSSTDFNAAIIVSTPGGLSGPLSSTSIYIIDGIIDFTGTGLSIEVPVGGLNLAGWTFDVSKLISADNDYALFTSPIGGSGNLLGNDYSIEVTGTNSKVYDLADSDGQHAFEFSRINYNNCSSLGTIDGYRQGLETGTGRFGGTPELTLAGVWSGGYSVTDSIARSLVDGSYSLYKAGAGFTMASRFKSNQNIDLNTTISFFDFAPSNFLSPSTVQLDNCIVTRNGVFDAADATIIPNTSSSDLVSEWSGNTGIKNTYPGGELNNTVESPSVVSEPGGFVDLVGTWATSDLQHCDSPVNGRIRHLDDSPREYKVTGQMVLESAQGDEVDLKIVIWRDGIGSFVDGKTIRRTINNLAGGRDVAYFFISDNIILNYNDYIKAQVANVDSGANDITAEVDSFFNISAR